MCSPLAGTQLYIFTNDGTGALSLAHTYTLAGGGFRDRNCRSEWGRQSRLGRGR